MIVRSVLSSPVKLERAQDLMPLKGSPKCIVYTHTHIDQTQNNPLPTRLHYGKSPVRETHTFTYTELHQTNRRSGRHTHSHTQNPLPTRLHQANRRSGKHTHSHTQNCTRQIAGQGDTHIHIHRTDTKQMTSVHPGYI